MKLLTHNVLACPVKECVDSDNNFPLAIKADEIDRKELDPEEVNSDFLVRMLDRVDWTAFVVAAAGFNFVFPESIPENAKDDQSFLLEFHNALLNTRVTKGTLTCPNCHRTFFIENGIPNMLESHSKILDMDISSS